MHQDHAYFCQKCAPLILDVKEKICMLEKICADQKSELSTMHRKLNLSENRVSNFRSGNIPKTVHKSICQSALTGEGKKLSGLVISWNFKRNWTLEPLSNAFEVTNIWPTFKNFYKSNEILHEPIIVL